MTPDQQNYVKELRARHQLEREELRVALAGRKPGFLKELKRRHWLVEEETRLILGGMKGRT
jgi:hypothetical protein